MLITGWPTYWAPVLRSVTVHRVDELVCIVRGEDAELAGADVLPGLRLTLGELFG
jgi:hypothetical protein